MKYLIKNKYWEINKDYNKEKLLYFLIDRPDRNNNNVFVWYDTENQLHRDYDLPAFINNIGEPWWYKNHLRHREKSKPAIIWINNKKEYWINGNFTKWNI